MKKIFAVVVLILVIALIAVSCSQRQVIVSDNEFDLSTMKNYAIDHGDKMKTATSQLSSTSKEYYDLISKHDFDYGAAWKTDGKKISSLLSDVKSQWLDASTHYELDEGIIAGVPLLADFDVWIDAGPSGEEDPIGARDWELNLPNGKTMQKPGNLFHNLLEPAIWGTQESFVGLTVDLDGDGKQELGEVLPDANILLASAKSLDDATSQMNLAVNGWDPTLEDAFTALAIMIPTMNEYFEQWKLSTFVTGEVSDEKSFVAISRLFDVAGILNGLNVTYMNVAPLVSAENPSLDAQIRHGFEDLIGYVDNLRKQEISGKRFSPQEAERFGTEAQSKATSLSGQVIQAAELLNVKIEE